MEWTDDDCIQLINLYKLRSILWDPKHPYYKMGKKKIDFWLQISNELRRDVNKTKKKMESLLGGKDNERSEVDVQEQKLTKFIFQNGLHLRKLNF